MISNDKVTEIFFDIDEFCKVFEPAFTQKLLEDGKKHRKRAFKMSMSEILTITVIFQLSGHRTFKHFYLFYIQKHMKSEFPDTVSYNRFTELMQANMVPLVLFMKTRCLGKSTGISFIDSTPLRVCKNKRIKVNKVFEGIATTGRSTMGWFHGFKLHLIVNDKGEILNFVLTQGNVDDRDPLKEGNILNEIFGKLYADKGYISKNLASMLFEDGLHLITGIRNNMKNVLMTMRDKILLRKRSVIETINDQLKNICHAEHSRHRSFGNFITNLVASLIAYSFQEKKPAIKFEEDIKSKGQLALFC
ncbi:Transposase DDE domain-containing protein [Salegentibacter echinorum]|uniref:Transposase DDE domain-containing protein n=1 Tax=Salegentibacter echinorum TaxID=1073325 RepID=A0A1M5MNS6_SALEC|nr:IS982 family transposase [Salegentibacter echinorum]SHG78549.1 Transposase DDE domain-containing protein [Salegentibacter echinorum]